LVHGCLAFFSQCLSEFLVDICRYDDMIGGYRRFAEYEYVSNERSFAVDALLWSGMPKLFQARPSTRHSSHGAADSKPWNGGCGFGSGLGAPQKMNDEP